MLSNRAGSQFLRERKLEVLQGFATWEGIQSSPSDTSQLSEITKRHLENKIFQPITEELEVARRLGTYYPPSLAKKQGELRVRN